MRPSKIGKGKSFAGLVGQVRNTGRQLGEEEHKIVQLLMRSKSSLSPLDKEALSHYFSGFPFFQEQA